MYISTCVQLYIFMALLNVNAIYLPGFQIFSLILLLLSFLILYGYLPSLTSVPEILRMGQNEFLKDSIFCFNKFYKREVKHNFSLLSVILLLFANE